MVDSSSLAFYDLSFVPEAGEVVVGRVDTGAYVVLPSDGVDLLRKMMDGMTPTEAGAWYEAEFGEPIDVDDFVETLHELGFVRIAGSPDTSPERTGPVRFQWLGKAVFSPVAWLVQVAVVTLWLILVIRHRDLRPAASQIFFTGSLIIVQLVITLGQTPLLFLHEGYHMLAGRRLGLPTRMDLSTRWTYIVFETQINGVLSVPRRKRYLPFLAGMFCDCVVLALFGIVAEVTRNSDGSLALVGRVCLALAVTQVARLGWQFQLHLRTDLYYVFATALSCYDLHEAGKALLWNRIWRRLRRPDRVVDEQQWTDHDRRVGAFYGPFLILGICALLAVSAYVTIPVVVQYFLTAVRNLASGQFDAHFWDAVLSLGGNAAQFFLLIVLSRRKRRQQALRTAMTAGPSLSQQGVG